ncbi:hypothetical protein CFIMG_002924RAa [Ceratocystis fimbriata CBS 114723]|uniref:Rhodopsin domain-containing protein n=1 Tax=Ceratocystis fimbriata CBS 114723 TaxID=1035309 RepID=A0A2C5X3R0_9PEZI|nr:hypothetical protein CFIMG_002924RAa [Ceratocystis fimbriata CBS 114723]
MPAALEAKLAAFSPQELAAFMDEYNGGPLFSVTVAFLTISWISILLRTYVRVFLTRSFLLDDCFMLAAQFVYTTSSIFIILGIKYGIGKHNVALEVKDMTHALMFQVLTTETYVLNMMLLKFSIGIFLLRLSMRKVYTYTIWISLIVVTIWSVVILFFNILQCNPIQSQWDITIEHRKCIDSNQVVNAAYSVSAMTIVTDWLYAILPVPMLWDVKMNTQTKVTVILVLGLGVFASVATIIRFQYLVTINDQADVLYAATNALIWTMVEPAVATTASCLSTIRPLLRKLRVRGFETTEGANSMTGGRGPRSGQSRSKHYSEIRPGDIELGSKKTVTTTMVAGATETRSSSSSETQVFPPKTTPLPSAYIPDKHSTSSRTPPPRKSSDPNFFAGNQILHTTRIEIQSQSIGVSASAESKPSPSEPRSQLSDLSTTVSNNSMRPSQHTSRVDRGDNQSLHELDIRPHQNRGPLGSHPHAMF